MGDLRRHDRDAAREALGDHLPEMQAAVEARSEARGHADVAKCLDDLAEGELVEWVAVTVHRGPDGTSYTNIHSHPDLTPLQVKGLLHGGIWALVRQQ